MSAARAEHVFRSNLQLSRIFEGSWGVWGRKSLVCRNVSDAGQESLKLLPFSFHYTCTCWRTSVSKTRMLEPLSSEIWCRSWGTEENVWTARRFGAPTRQVPQEAEQTYCWMLNWRRKNADSEFNHLSVCLDRIWGTYCQKHKITWMICWWSSLLWTAERDLFGDGIAGIQTSGRR